MPQLSIGGDQVDPLTLRPLFFFKCKNMDSLSKEKEISAFCPVQIEIWKSVALTDEAVFALPLCISERNWWPDSGGERTSRQRTADTATVEAYRVTPKGTDGMTERAAQPSSAALPIHSFFATSRLPGDCWTARLSLLLRKRVGGLFRSSVQICCCDIKLQEASERTAF